MSPNDDVSGGSPAGPRDLRSQTDFADSGAALHGAGRPSRYMPGLAGTGFSENDMTMLGQGLPVGLAAPSIQLAHALELLSRPHRSGSDDAGPCDIQADRRDRAAAQARQLIGDALSSLAGSAGLSVPMSAYAQPAEEPPAVDPELEAVFVEFDAAREAWQALPAAAEAWAPRAEVDRYLAAEDAVLNIADGREDVLERQAGLLIELADEIADQLGASAANAVANIAQGLLVRLGR